MLTSGPQRFSCPHLPSSEIKSMCHHTQLFPWVLGVGFRVPWVSGHALWTEPSSNLLYTSVFLLKCPSSLLGQPPFSLPVPLRPQMTLPINSVTWPNHFLSSYTAAFSRHLPCRTFGPISHSLKTLSIVSAHHLRISPVSSTV